MATVAMAGQPPIGHAPRRAITGGQMLDNSGPASGHKERAETRTNLFMSAALHIDGLEQDAKIRDLSAEGAQLECSPVPAAGTAMTLIRGRLTVQGRVSWSAARRCGVQFFSRIRVRDWMANPVNAEQQRVDRLVAVVKSGQAPKAPPAAHLPAAAEGVTDDLKRVSELLAVIADALAGDPAAVIRHGVTLQGLDIAVQTLAVLAETIPADDPRHARHVARLAELRTACAAALR